MHVADGIRLMEVSDCPELPVPSFTEEVDITDPPSYTTHLEIAVESKVLGGWVLIGPVPERGLR